MQPIEYKLLYDGEGLIEGLELWQSGEHITVSLETKGTHRNGYRWAEVKGFIDSLKLPTQEIGEIDSIFVQSSLEKNKKGA